jgi:hypothetical protein
MSRAWDKVTYLMARARFRWRVHFTQNPRRRRTDG